MTRQFELGRVIEGYLLACQVEGKSERTICIYGTALERMHQYLGKIKIGEITPRIMREYLSHLQNSNRYEDSTVTPAQEDTLAPATVHIHFRSIRTFFNWAVREGFPMETPLLNIGPPKVPSRVIRTLTVDELRRLLKSFDLQSPTGFRNYAITLTLLDIGVRVSELISLTLEDVKLTEQRLRVMGKGRKERFVPIGVRVQRALWKYIYQFRPEPSRPVIENLFLTQRGQPVTSDRARKMLKKHSEQAGIGHVHPHAIRHTFAKTYLVNEGDMISLQRILGHSTLEMTRRYIALLDGDIQRAHRRASPVDNLRL